MNKNIAKPLIIQFTPPEASPVLKKSPKSVFVPVNTPWVQFRDTILPLVANSAYDSVLVHTKDDVDRDMKGVVGNMSVKMNALAGAGTKADKFVLSYDAHDKPFYLANPGFDEMKAAGLYAPSNETIMAKYNSYGTDAAWQKRQGQIWDRMKDMMPLSHKSDQFNRDHAAQLKDPKRGLEDADLDKFWSFQSGKQLSPTIMGDDMVGMPSVEGREYAGFTMSVSQPDGTVRTIPLQVRSLKTVGPSGIAIPMANADGHVNKHQIAADLTAYGTKLKFRAADGKTVSRGELFDDKTREYGFKFADGTDTHLKVTAVSQNDTITLKDTRGLFNVKPKKEIIDVLKERGYEVPPIITSVKPEQNGKYMWQSPGTMTGSQEVLKTVSPSNPGFIKAREPKNGSDQYVVLVAEGALKGHIVAKYIDVKDKEGECFGDKIAGDKGIIVTQVPGVAEAYVKNALTVYDKYNVAGTYIAMDADGRENRNVAIGIHSAYKYISQTGPTTVLSWDPAQKGMDDALLAVAQGRITVAEMGIVSGKPEALFPLDKAHAMTPYKLDGTQTTKPSWVQEYEDDKKTRLEKIAQAQAATAARQVEKDMHKLEGQKAGQWVETPKDISNIQNTTVAKAADMADAMNGVIPPAKPDPKVTHTPDVDEVAAEKAVLEEMNQGRQEKTQGAKQPGAGNEDNMDDGIKKWDAANPPMPPITIPDGYKSTYAYKQPVIRKPGRPADIPGGLVYEGDRVMKDGKGWGIVSFETDHEMSEQEVKDYQDKLADNGMAPVGSMRLVGQSVTLDPEGPSLMASITAMDEKNQAAETTDTL